MTQDKIIIIDALTLGTLVGTLYDFCYVIRGLTHGI